MIEIAKTNPSMRKYIGASGLIFAIGPILISSLENHFKSLCIPQSIRKVWIMIGRSVFSLLKMIYNKTNAFSRVANETSNLIVFNFPSLYF
jgi:hypothetical protein